MELTRPVLSSDMALRISEESKLIAEIAARLIATWNEFNPEMIEANVGIAAKILDAALKLSEERVVERMQIEIKRRRGY